MEALEAAVNEKIRLHVPVNVELLSIGDPAVEKVRVYCLSRVFICLKQFISVPVLPCALFVFHFRALNISNSAYEDH